MRRFVEGADRSQRTLFPECLEDWIGEDNPVRVIDVFVDELDLADLGFGGVAPEITGRPSYHPSVLLKLYIYGYLKRHQNSSSMPYDDKTIEDPERDRWKDKKVDRRDARRHGCSETCASLEMVAASGGKYTERLSTERPRSRA